MGMNVGTLWGLEGVSQGGGGGCCYRVGSGRAINLITTLGYVWQKKLDNDLMYGE